ncbi:MAG: DNA-3-methyladenine glycosylase 2 family protein [Solirubrobacterales bacterium]|nr:DNA-3-methyladenine glycosylase 2 family protein [Solirubrobacterales bacterium]
MSDGASGARHVAAQDQDDAGRAHLSAADPVIAAVIARVGDDALGHRATRPSDHWGVLVRAIIAQQVSVASADAIFGRLQEFFGGIPTPEQMFAADPDVMRSAAGLSRAKTAYLRSLAEHAATLEDLADLSDEEVRARLTAIKGIGPWTADIFLIFHLRRPDVVALGDVGLQRAVANLYGPEATLAEVAERWRPHRTLGCLYLWRSLDATPA